MMTEREAADRQLAIMVQPLAAAVDAMFRRTIAPLVQAAARCAALDKPLAPAALDPLIADISAFLKRRAR
jgi:hypothetical protein